MRQPDHTSAFVPSRAPQEPRGAEAAENQDKDRHFFFSPCELEKFSLSYPDCEAREMKDSSQTSKTTIYQTKKDFLTLSVLHFVYMNESQLSRPGTIL